MKRTPMKRTGFLGRRSASVFAQKPAASSEKPIRELQPASRPATYAGTTTAAPPKQELIQHQGYMAIVRKLPCAHCGIPGISQFCHSDEGKGTGIKSDCRHGWPGCPACHVAVGTTRIYPREERRAIEAHMAANTRKKVQELGLWPKSLPLLEQDQITSTRK